MSHDSADFGADVTGPPQQDAGLTDDEILAFIARIQNGAGRRQYLSVRRPDGSDAGPQ